MSEVRFVYFDLGNVLARFDVQRACGNLQRQWALDPHRVQDALWTSGLQERFEHGELSPEQFAAEARAALGLDEAQAPTEQLLDLLCDMFEPIDEMEEVIEAVRRSAVAVGILSNTCHSHWHWISKQRYAAIAGPFERVILSYEHGVMKPAESLFRIATELSGVAPESILFFDDRPENVAAAASAGWQAHQFTDAKSAREVLHQLGVLKS